MARLAVSYTNADRFYSEYIASLSLGGVFVPNARVRELLDEEEIEIVLPGQGRWLVLAQAVMQLPAGAAFQITRKPPGFDEGLLGYFLRVGRRREVTLLLGEVPGDSLFAELGYRIERLCAADDIPSALASGRVVAAVVPPTLCAPYRADPRVFAVGSLDDLPDVIARIDTLL